MDDNLKNNTPTKNTNKSNTTSKLGKKSLSSDQEDKSDKYFPNLTPAHHPTGNPELTENWQSDESQSTFENDNDSSNHPTGNPEITGGWFSEDLEYSNNTSGSKISSEFDFPLDEQSYKYNNYPSKSSLNNSSPHLRKVELIDPDATRVTPSLYIRSQSQKPSNNRLGRTITYSNIKDDVPTSKGPHQGIGCIIRIVLVTIFLGILISIGILSFFIYKYYSIAATLPNVENLKQHASQFETTRILDRNGNLLYELIDPNAGRRTYVPLDNISPYAIAATIATEDKEFYNHPGYDPVAILRAFWQNYTTGNVVSGASTITQQLARTLLLSPEERNQITAQRKAREIVLAAELTRLYSKEEILELYMNENYYSNMAYGIEAAAETYFNTTADKLTLGQASFLAGLPQAPSVYDIFTNREETLKRHVQVLVLLYEVSQEKGCIDVSTNVQPICIDAEAATQALQEIEDYPFKPNEFLMKYPHWVNFIRASIESQYDPQTIYRSGFTIYTTLDPNLQDLTEDILRKQVASLADRHVTNGALVAIQPTTGEILAMVGSSDFYNEAISGQVNMATSPRQPGSAIKPITYTAAFEKGWTPATLIWDVPSEFPPSGDKEDTRIPYKPINYDEKFHGPVTVRTALANSYNIPAVKTLQFVGIYDDPNTPEKDGMINLSKRLGISSLTRQDYGLSLTLGGGEVTLLEMTSAYATFANSGLYLPPVAITRITDFQGNIIFDYKSTTGDQVIRPEHAFLTNSILSDNDARTPMFGVDSVLNLPFMVAVKTGTTNDYRDNWTLGYTPDIAIGVWVGNADYTPMESMTGVTGAAPIWAQAIKVAIQELTGNNPSSFFPPSGIVEKVICGVSGAEPSEWCPSQRSEYFAYDQLPLTKENDLWQKTHIDSWTGYLVSSYCSGYQTEKFVLNITDPWAIKWIKENNQGKSWAKNNGFSDPIFIIPERECTDGDPKPEIEFAGLSDGQIINYGSLDIYAIINATQNYKEWRLEYGIGDDPEEWRPLLEHITTQYSQPEKIYNWDISNFPIGTVTLRIYMSSTQDTYAEKRLHLNFQVPTLMPTLTSSPTQTPTSTFTNTPTLTPSETSTPTQTDMAP